MGLACQPIELAEGWLVIYHGSDIEDRYTLAAALLDLDDPTCVHAWPHTPLMQPEADYEVTGFYGNVVFSCGAVQHDPQNLTIYYGASDESTAAADTTIPKIMSTLQEAMDH